MAEQKPIISIDHVSMRFNLSKEKHESLKEYFVALLHGGVRFDEFFALDDVSFDIMPGDFYGLIGLNVYAAESDFRRLQAQRRQGHGQRYDCAADRIGRGL